MLSRDARIGLMFAASLMFLGFAAGSIDTAHGQEVDPFDHVVTSSLTRVPLDNNQRARIGEIATWAVAAPCFAPVVFEHYSSGFWIGVCNNADMSAFAWAPTGDITETGMLADVLSHTFGELTGMRWVSPDRIDFNFIQY